MTFVRETVSEFLLVEKATSNSATGRRQCQRNNQTNPRWVCMEQAGEVGGESLLHNNVPPPATGRLRDLDHLVAGEGGDGEVEETVFDDNFHIASLRDKPRRVERTR